MINDLARGNAITGLTAEVSVTVKPREISGTNIDAKPVTRLETIGRGPQINFETIDSPWFQQLRLTFKITIASAQYAILQLDGSTIGKYIAKPSREVCVDSARTCI